MWKRSRTSGISEKIKIENQKSKMSFDTESSFDIESQDEMQDEVQNCSLKLKTYI
jgi:hypothetical protein